MYYKIIRIKVGNAVAVNPLTELLAEILTGIVESCGSRKPCAGTNQHVVGISYQLMQLFNPL